MCIFLFSFRCSVFTIFLFLFRTYCMTYFYHVISSADSNLASENRSRWFFLTCMRRDDLICWCIEFIEMSARMTLNMEYRTRTVTCFGGDKKAARVVSYRNGVRPADKLICLSKTNTFGLNIYRRLQTEKHKCEGVRPTTDLDNFEIKAATAMLIW